MTVNQILLHAADKLLKWISQLISKFRNFVTLTLSNTDRFISNSFIGTLIWRICHSDVEELYTHTLNASLHSVVKYNEWRFLNVNMC